MSDPRLNSSHFECLDRRRQYRSARETLLASRGWLTLTAEQFRALIGDSQDWPALLPVRPDRVLPARSISWPIFRPGARTCSGPG